MKENQKNEVSEDILKQLLSVDPETVYASGYASWQKGNYSRAVIDFSWLVMAQPWSWRAHIALAGAWMMLKEYSTAINFYGHALMSASLTAIGAVLDYCLARTPSADQENPFDELPADPSVLLAGKIIESCQSVTLPASRESMGNEYCGVGKS